MTAAAFRRSARPERPLRGPLLAGLGAALVFAAILTAIALFGDPGAGPAARAALGPAPEPAIRLADAGAPGDTETPAADSTRRPIEFLDPEEGEPTLPGAPIALDASGLLPGSDPARAEAAHAAAERARHALPGAPFAGLTEPGPSGPLPVIGPDGTRPSRAYARSFDIDGSAPSIALVVGGMGLNRAVTEAAIERLPPEVALAFAPYARDLQGWIDRARAAGHEVLLELPLEPFDYPNNDPGPHTLLADAGAIENGRRLNWLLSQAAGYFAVSNYLGARFTGSESAMTELMTQLEARGVAFLHDGAGRRPGVERAGAAAGAEWGLADRVLDEDPSPRAVDAQLLALEALALQNGHAIGAGFAYPATVDQVAQWAAGLERRGYQLAPPSAVIRMRRGADAGAG